MGATEITCKIIPLYRVTIQYEPKNEKDDYYERHIVADSIEGLIQGISDIEIGWKDNLEDRRMTFEITDFLLLPCKDQLNGYHLFDIDEVDCGGWYGSSIDNAIYYHTYFSLEEHPGPGIRDRSQSKFAEPLPVMGSSMSTSREVDDIMCALEESDAVMGAIFSIARASEYYRKRKFEETKQNEELNKRAFKSVASWRDIENKQVEFIKMLEDVANFKPKKATPPNYGKHPNRSLDYVSVFEDYYKTVSTNETMKPL